MHLQATDSPASYTTQNALPSDELFYYKRSSSRAGSRAGSLAGSLAGSSIGSHGSFCRQCDHAWHCCHTSITIYNSVYILCQTLCKYSYAITIIGVDYKKQTLCKLIINRPTVVAINNYYYYIVYQYTVHLHIDLQNSICHKNMQFFSY